MSSAQSMIPPFWTRVPRFFLFPLNPVALWRVMLFAAIPAIGAFATSPVAMGVAVSGLSLLAWIFLLRFGSRVLSETALGRLSPGDYSLLPDEALRTMPYKIMGLFIIPGIFVGLITGLFGNGLGMLANFLVTVVTPAALMALVISGSLFTGLNPAVGWSVISRIGKPYLLLCVFLYCLSAAQMFLVTKVMEHTLVPLMLEWGEYQEALQQAVMAQDEVAFTSAAEGMSHLMDRSHSRLAGAVWLINAVAMHFTLIAFNMLGYVLYQFHESLGLEVDMLPGRRNQSGASAQLDPESQHIAQLLAEGNTQEALDVAYEAQRVDPDNAAVQERYNKLLHLAGKDERLISHAQKLIPLLLDKGMGPGALETWKRCREKRPDFRPERAETVLQLAEAARAQRDPKLAMKILNGFDTAFRHHPLVPEVYFLGGKILCEDLNQDTMAERFFITLANRFPDHPRVAESMRLREVIARMKAAPSPSKV